MPTSDELRDTFPAMDIEQLRQRLASEAPTEEAAEIARRVIDERAPREEVNSPEEPSFASKHRRKTFGVWRSTLRRTRCAGWAKPHWPAIFSGPEGTMICHVSLRDRYEQNIDAWLVRSAWDNPFTRSIQNLVSTLGESPNERKIDVRGTLAHDCLGGRRCRRARGFAGYFESPRADDRARKGCRR
jgi:hypothetical protein